MKKISFVGSGIKTIAHLTKEAVASISSAEKTLFLLNEPVMKEWIRKNSKLCEDLDPIYHSTDSRIICYNRIVEHILSESEHYNTLCVVLYGHPSVFSTLTQDTVTSALSNNIEVEVLPGISAEDCLFADLNIDPGKTGCQSFEATDFILYRRQFDSRSYLILWQIGMLGSLTHTVDKNNQSDIFQILKNYLLEIYKPCHRITVYEASLYPTIPSVMNKTVLSDFDIEQVNRLSTVCIPPDPACRNIPNKKILALLTQQTALD